MCIYYGVMVTKVALQHICVPGKTKNTEARIIFKYYPSCERASDLCHGTQTMNSSRVCDYLLSVKAATMAIEAWTMIYTEVLTEATSSTVCNLYHL